jgi:Fur family ferric uptake transcriptional regulator
MSELTNREAYIKQFDLFLDKKKMRKTPERFAILRRILMFPSHFTIESLMESMEQGSFHVSRATIYNTIQLLVEAQLVRRHVFEGLQVQYEKAGATPHSHLICTSCGKVKEVRDANFIAYMNARKFTAFTTNFYSLYVYGTCSTCARRMKKRKATPNKEG